MHPDGRAVRIENAYTSQSNGTWQIHDDGTLAVTFTMEFRVKDDSELIELELVPTDHDFPWDKVEDDAYRWDR